MSRPSFYKAGDEQAISSARSKHKEEVKRKVTEIANFWAQLKNKGHIRIQLIFGFTSSLVVIVGVQKPKIQDFIRFFSTVV